MFTVIEEMLLNLAYTMSLEFFVVLASFVEEVIAPIPSPTVMTLSGFLAQVQEYSLWGLLLLSVLGAFGKTMGAVIVYGIAVKLEDIVVNRFGGYFGITHEDIQSFGAKLTGKPKDYVIMTLLRSAPFVPSSVVSVGSGLLKVPFTLYLISTFVGTMVRDSFYLLAGYFGLKIVEDLLPKFDNIETLIEVLVGVMVIGFISYTWFKKRSATKNNNVGTSANDESVS